LCTKNNICGNSTKIWKKNLIFKAINSNSIINSFVKESFNSELNQLKMSGNVIILKRSKHLMGSIVISDQDNIDPKVAEEGLNELLCHLENMCPELGRDQLDTGKIEFLVEQYASNIL